MLAFNIMLQVKNSYEKGLKVSGLIVKAELIL